MRHVVDSSEVPHLWFHKAQDSARSKGRGNLYFEGDTIYSYGSHFPIARHVQNKRGQAAVLFTTRDYSVTTSGHKGMVRRAIPSGVTVFRVPGVSVWGGNNADHAENVDYYLRTITDTLNKASRAKKYQDSLLQDATELAAEAVAYAKFFGLPKPKVPNVPKVNLEKLRKAQAAESAKQAKATRERNAFEKLETTEKIRRWIAGEPVRFPDSYKLTPEESATRLRIQGENVETSRGAVFPVEHARKALPLIRRVWESGQEWNTNGHSIHLGPYKLDKILADGTVVAGCHTVSRAEVERIAGLL